jgi:hypothetical protein
VNILQAMQDDNLFGRWFSGPSWTAWQVFLKVLFGLRLQRAERKVFAQCTGRSTIPNKGIAEAWLVVGRRGGKSRVAALVAVFLACFRDYTQYLAPGERCTVMVIAVDRKQARVIMRYVRALIEGVPMLRKLVEREAADAIDLSNRVTIEVHTASYRSTRGYTVAAFIGDEVAFWRSEDSANPDREIIDAIRPATATIPGALLLGISSPYARRGALWEAHRDHYAKDSDVLVWQADSRLMNPTIPQRVVDAAYERDPASAAAEFGAQFRADIETFLHQEWLDAAVVEGRHALPPCTDVQYMAFADPSGGGQDAFTLAIAHVEGERVVLDYCRARRPPFKPENVCAEYAVALGRYGLRECTGDRYAAQWVVDAFRKVGVTYVHARKSKSEIYLEAEPLFAQGAVELLDDRHLLTELRQLERRTGRQGKDSVDHPPRGHDDMANSACGALWLCRRGDEAGEVNIAWTDSEPQPFRGFQIGNGYE